MFLGCSAANARLWAVATAFALPLGVYSGWGAVLAINLNSFGISAIDAGWFGCWMTLSGCVGGVVVGTLTDRFRGHMKSAILACYSVSTLGFLAFALVGATASPGGGSGTNSTGIGAGAAARVGGARG